MTQPSIFDFPVESRVPGSGGRSSRKSIDGDRMAAAFRSKPNERISALWLEDNFGLRWRTTVSDLRFAPYDMDIRNEQEPYVTADFRHKRKSFYRYVPGAGVR